MLTGGRNLEGGIKGDTTRRGSIKEELNGGTRDGPSKEAFTSGAGEEKGWL